MSRRPLVFVSGLTLGDYLLWNWSLNGNHDVLALVSGLTLPPLAVVSLWMLALGIGAAARPRRAHGAAIRRAAAAARRRPRSAAATATAEPASPDVARRALSRRKLAA